MKKNKKLLKKQTIGPKMLFIFLGTLIGAGIASGKEIVTFFGAFGFWSFISVLFVLAFLFIGIIATLSLCKKLDCDNIFDLNKLIFGKLSWISTILILISNLVIFASMFAGIDSIFGIIFPNQKYPVFYLISIVVCFFILALGFDSIVKTNGILIPILIVFVVIVSIIGICNGDLSNTSFSINISMYKSLIWSSILYGFSNAFSAVPIVVPFSKKLNTKQISIWCFLSSLVFCILLLLMMICVFSNTEFFNHDIPMLEICIKQVPKLAVVFSGILFVASFTTLISCGFVLTSFTNKFIENRYISSFIVMVSGLLFSMLGFSKIVNAFYPVLGAFGVFYILVVFFKLHKHNKNKILIERKHNYYQTKKSF